jgi:AcrR family transcriptional regulator
MSLYRHVEDKEDLVAAVAERVMSGIQVPDGRPDDWEGRVVAYLRALRDAAVEHPALCRILADRGLTVGTVFDQVEELHGILLVAGFSETAAVRSHALLTYVFGFVIWELPRVRQQPADAYGASWNDSIDSLDRTAFPRLHALRRPSTTTASPDQVEFGLNHLVQSIGVLVAPRGRVRPAPRGRRAKGS